MRLLLIAALVLAPAAPAYEVPPPYRQPGYRPGAGFELLHTRTAKITGGTALFFLVVRDRSSRTPSHCSSKSSGSITAAHAFALPEQSGHYR